MGRKGSRSRGKKPNNSEKTRAINPTWWDCTPAFYKDAVKLLANCDEHLVYLLALREGDDEKKARELATDHDHVIQSRLQLDGETIAKRYSKSPLAHHLAGHSRMALGKHRQALPYLEEASVLQPNCLEIAHSLAAAHAELEQFGLAAAECRRALAIDNPTDPILHTVLRVPPKLPEDDAPGEAKVRVAVAKERLRGLLADVRRCLVTSTSAKRFGRG